ncbi:E3 ubiquitin-protein ligase SH3RF1-like isoform X2 [Sitodiplosis mosellana]|uniref:E3 ubiquitin-protein ligase SH3RF1-like isoform X2 n=1 Tax=Sitodiplosis mosellana TaxID=263140 RepID=UPI00244532F6|nr:E3 ubiquitin-protein ligase SH3RF1-like isoform X2 [Sitodiplosis mosellana]
MDDILIDINRALECSVCLERLDSTSKVLPCQHTFCRKCLQVIVSSHSELRCPECRILVEVEIDNLPPNIILMRILSGLKNTTNIDPHNVNLKHSINSEATSLQSINSKNNKNNNGSIQSVQSVLKANVAPNESTNEYGLNGLDSSPNDQQQKRSAASNHESAQRTTVVELKLNENQFVDVRSHLVAQQQHKQQSVLVPNSSITPHATALYNFESKEPGDLSLRTGDKVLLRRRIDVNWFEGECHGREGVFPSNYVHIVVPLPQPQCKALYDFRMGPNEEEGCLTFKKGAIINVLCRVDPNWAEGCIDETIGIFPIAFVEMNSLAKQLMESSVNSNSTMGQRNVPPTPNENQQQQQQNGSFSSESSNLKTMTSLASPNSTTTNNSNRCSTSIMVSNGALKNEQLLANDNKRESPRSTCNMLSASDTGHKKSNQNFITRNISKEKIPIQNHSKVQISGNKSSGGKSNQRQHHHFASGANTFIALYPYKPQKCDELELKKGSIYYVSERCKDGWLRGSSRSQNKSGVFPGNYVAPLRSVNEQLTPASIGVVDCASLSCNNVSNKSCHINPPELPPRFNTSLSTSTSTSTSASSATSVWSKPIGQHVEAIFGRSTLSSGSTVNLIKRITNIKANNKHQPTMSYSMDNPVFEDNAIGCFETTNASSISPPSKPNTIHMSQPIHVRSGSCPEPKLLQCISADINHSLPAGTSGQKAETFGSHRIRPNKDRSSLQGFVFHPFWFTNTNTSHDFHHLYIIENLRVWMLILNYPLIIDQMNLQIQADENPIRSMKNSNVLFHIRETVILNLNWLSGIYCMSTKSATMDGSRELMLKVEKLVFFPHHLSNH